MASSGTFTAFFNMEGNAEDKLRRIALNMDLLRSSSRRTTDVLEPLINRLGELGASEKVDRLHDIADALQKMSLDGKSSSATLQKFANELAIMGDTLPELGEELHGLSNELLAVAAPLKFTEFNARKVNQEFTFMGDVGEKTALTMRYISASAQGSMIAMSLLQKNITGLAFSLIFLQFSGALKLSLAFAALSFAGGLVFKGLQKVFALKKEAGEMSASMFTVTGSMKSFALAQDRAEAVGKNLLLTGSKQKEVLKALTSAQVTLRRAGFEATEEAFQAFLSLVFDARNAGESYESSLESARVGMLSFARDGTVTVEGTILGLEELQRRGGNALRQYRGDTEGVIATLDTVLDEHGNKLVRTEEIIDHLAGLEKDIVLEFAAIFPKLGGELTRVTEHMEAKLAAIGIKLVDEKPIVKTASEEFVAVLETSFVEGAKKANLALLDIANHALIDRVKAQVEALTDAVFAERFYNIPSELRTAEKSLTPTGLTEVRNVITPQLPKVDKFPTGCTEPDSGFQALDEDYLSSLETLPQPMNGNGNGSTNTTININVTGNKISNEEDGAMFANQITQSIFRLNPGLSVLSLHA